MPTQTECMEMQKQLKEIQKLKPAGDAPFAHIAGKAYPPYPRTKIAYYEIMQRTINEQQNKGYYEGRHEAIREHTQSEFHKVVDALCIVAIKLAEKS